MAQPWSPQNDPSRPSAITLQPGAAGDASVLELETGDFDYVDSTGERLAGRTRFSARGVVMNGHWWKG
jgi:dihydroorotase